MRDFQTPGRSAVFAAGGMCATSHPLAARTAVRMLEDGGNAVDAAIAAAVLLGFCEPQMCGIGGDLFALVKPAGQETVVGINASGRAPAGLDAGALRAAGHHRMPLQDPAAVTMPGAVAGFARLAADWGRAGLDACLAPAIASAENGVPVAPRVALDWAGAEATLQGEARRWFLRDGRPPSTGDLFRAPGQAEVLRRIARDGARGFYEGEVAADMVASLRALGGCHTAEDFAACSADQVAPVVGRYRGHELLELPPNGQGAAAILLAQILGQFDMARLDPLGVERAHLEAEATRLAYDARDRFIADPGLAPVPLAHLLSGETAAALAALIDRERAMPDPRPASAAVHGAAHRDTVLVCVVDRERMAVSLIYSTFHSFGSGLASSRFGINFNNRGAGFSLEAGHPNEAASGKRPLHTIIPAMLRHEGRVVMPFGVMGGAYQATGHARLIGNLLDHGMDLQTAIDAPRSFAEGGQLWLETGYVPEIARGLAARGHDVAWRDSALGGAQAIWIDHERGVLTGASDPRKDGCALGY